MIQLIAPLLAMAIFLTVVNAVEGTATFKNSRRLMFDVNGNQIDVVAGHSSFLNGKYYLYGSGSTGGVNAYSSIDLINWHKEGALGYGGSRPHIIYNSASKKYFVWADGAGTSGYVVGSSTSPATGYTALGIAATDPSYSSLQKADMSVEVMPDGRAYLVHSALNFADPRAGSMWPQVYQTMHILQLTSDYTSTTKVAYNVSSAANDLVDNQLESPDLFYRAPYYYVAASNTCGLCSGSLVLLYRSMSVQGPWTRQILAGNGCNTQLEGVLPVVDQSTNTTTYLFQGNSIPGSSRTVISGRVWQPLVWNDDGSAQPLNCSEESEFSVPLTLGDGPAASGKATAATDGSPLLADYSMVCDSDVFNLYQTWVNSKTGILKEIGVNVASTVQTGSLNIKVFKISNLNEFISPGYKWTLLNSTVFTRAQIPVTLGVVSVMLNAPVQKGDMLGISYGNNYANGMFVAGGDTVPYCHLEYPTNTTAEILFEQGAGQNSPRGIDGKTSPIVPRTGKGIKFYSIVQ